ncbi:MAG: transcriptional regulator NrdR [Veillonella sp.]|uniref:transcriptional regulator NrdR n=1 Tax=Veillonella sp. TaxID=1926307 RepID=UPI0025D2FA6D|nr:transcriptional regulator NrdR [Veillonella sp.]MBS4912611.1 transcriptional regulator NrdR [Veillonella sp.]
MRCPYCKHTENKVTDSRATDDGNSIRRRRECLSCGRRFTTYEVIEDVPIMVIKSRGNYEMFDRGKLLNGLLRSCNKRNIPREVLENVVKNVEDAIRNRAKQEIKSSEIGDLVLAELKDIDEVAYVRFASVYRNFDDVQAFVAVLEDLRKNDKHEVEK